MADKHTIGTLLVKAAHRLGEGSTSSARLDAELLLAHALGVSRAWLAAHSDEPADAGGFAALIERRAGGEPLAYIVGFKDFWTLSIAVTPAVLVPRPETELLVERALALIPAKAARVLDLGTGSGAIALALASERPGWQITATDTSAPALAVARANALRLALPRIEYLQGNWFEPVAGRTFDLLVSNPPYVAVGDAALAHPALACEPAIALSPGPDAMAALRTIVRDAPACLERNGWLLLEHGATQSGDVARALVARGFTHVRSHRDLAGQERMTEASWTGWREQ